LDEACGADDEGLGDAVDVESAGEAGAGVEEDVEVDAVVADELLCGGGIGADGDEEDLEGVGVGGVGEAVEAGDEGGTVGAAGVAEDEQELLVTVVAEGAEVVIGVGESEVGDLLAWLEGVVGVVGVVEGGAEGGWAGCLVAVSGPDCLRDGLGELVEGEVGYFMGVVQGEGAGVGVAVDGVGGAV